MPDVNRSINQMEVTKLPNKVFVPAISQTFEGSFFEFAEAEWHDVSDFNEVNAIVSALDSENITVIILFSHNGIDTLISSSGQAVTGSGYYSMNAPVAAKYCKLQVIASGRVSGDTQSPTTIDIQLSFSRVMTSVAVMGEFNGFRYPISPYISDVGQVLLKTQSYVAVFDDDGYYYNINGDRANGLDVDVTRLPGEEAGSLAINGISVTPKYAAISASASGNNTVVAGVTNKKIRVLALSLSASAAVNAKFKVGTSGADITGLRYMGVNGSWELPFNKLGWFETTSSQLLNLVLSSAVPVGGCITYIEV